MHQFFCILQCIALLADAEGWLLLDIGLIVLFFWSSSSTVNVVVFTWENCENGGKIFHMEYILQYYHYFLMGFIFAQGSCSWRYLNIAKNKKIIQLENLHVNNVLIFYTFKRFIFHGSGELFWHIST